MRNLDAVCGHMIELRLDLGKGSQDRCNKCTFSHNLQLKIGQLVKERIRRDDDTSDNEAV